MGNIIIPFGKSIRLQALFWYQKILKDFLINNLIASLIIFAFWYVNAVRSSIYFLLGVAVISIFASLWSVQVSKKLKIAP